MHRMMFRRCATLDPTTRFRIHYFVMTHVFDVITAQASLAVGLFRWTMVSTRVPTVKDFHDVPEPRRLATVYTNRNNLRPGSGTTGDMEVGERSASLRPLTQLAAGGKALATTWPAIADHDPNRVSQREIPRAPDQDVIMEEESSGECDENEDMVMDNEHCKSPINTNNNDTWSRRKRHRVATRQTEKSKKGAQGDGDIPMKDEKDEVNGDTAPKRRKVAVDLDAGNESTPDASPAALAVPPSAERKATSLNTTCPANQGMTDWPTNGPIPNSKRPHVTHEPHTRDPEIHGSYPKEPVKCVTNSLDVQTEPVRSHKRSSSAPYGNSAVTLRQSSLYLILVLDLALVSHCQFNLVHVDASLYLGLILVTAILFLVPLAADVSVPFLTRRMCHHRLFPHIIPPPHVPSNEPHDSSVLSDKTLRDFLMDPYGFHLGLAPAFFGFHAYFGALTAWDEHVILPATETTPSRTCLEAQILSVAGASAGAMSAVLVAAGIHPRRAADFCQSVTLSKFADFPGLGAAFKGDLFEGLMNTFMEKEKPDHSLQLQDGRIPVAVSAFDIKTMKEHLLRTGSMAKAARSSATFPLLFQPCHWRYDEDGSPSSAWFIDGGVTDMCGLNGLAVAHPQKTKRIVNLLVGNFPSGGAPGPSSMPKAIRASEVVSISIRNTPTCGPWTMVNGPKAQDASRRAMIAALDLPLYKGKDPGHYELHLDASAFVP